MLNKIMVQGRIANPIELKHTRNDVPVCSFGVAWSEKTKNKENTCFFNCVAYNNNAEFISRYFSKGDPIIVIGKLLIRKYTDSNNQSKSSTEIIVESAEFNIKSNNQPKQSSNSSNDVDIIDDFGDMPF